MPEALPYFVTPKAVDENSTLLQQLPHWAACSITQALEFLTPAYKGHPRVMAYVLRVLESYPPDRVTFFMPQLVQALRYDEGVSYLLEILIFSLSYFELHYQGPELQFRCLDLSLLIPKPTSPIVEYLGWVSVRHFWLLGLLDKQQKQAILTYIYIYSIPIEG